MMGMTESRRARRDAPRRRNLVRLGRLCGLLACVSLGAPLAAGAAKGQDRWLVGKSVSELNSGGITGP